MSAACPNCFETLAEPRPRFCPHCGQETALRPPRLGEFVQQFGGAYLSTEGALWRTLKLLLTKPGELTRQYLAGRRKHYVLPLRLFLTISLVVLLAMRVSATFGGAEPVRVDAGGGGQGLKSARIDLGFGSAGYHDGVFTCSGLPGWVCRRLEGRYGGDPGQLDREAGRLGERFLSSLGAAAFLLLPSFALWMKLFYWTRRMRYSEHLVFALHLHAFWFLCIGLSLAQVQWLTFAAFAAIPAYALLALRRVYGGGWAGTLLRASAVSVLHLTVLGVSLAVVGVYAVLF